MRKQITFLSILVLLIGVISANAQKTKSEFRKTVDSINAIIKANPRAYYMPSKQYTGYITKISVTQQGMIHFTDSIPPPDTTTTVSKKMVLISDCCPRKNSRTLDLFTIKEWQVIFPYLYLKDKNKDSFAKFVGFKKPDLYKLKEQFDKLTTLCKKTTTTEH